MGQAKLANSKLIDNNELRERYFEDGFVIVRNVLQNFEIEEILKACDSLEDQARDKTEDFFEKECFYNMHRDCDPFDKKLRESPVVKGMLRRVTYPYLVSSLVNMYRTHPKILESVAIVLGDSLKQITNQINFNHPGRGTGWGWHQDYRFRRQGIDELAEAFAQTLIAIDPCSPMNGGLRLIPKSQKLGGLTLDSAPETAGEFFSEDQAVCPQMDPGDMLIFQPFVIHGSSANESRYPRRVFINGYAKAEKSDHGILVMSEGIPVPHAEGIMEYEGDRLVLPKASKY